MKKVEFVDIESKIGEHLFGKGIVKEFDGALPIIKNRIENGWEYEGFIPTATLNNGELIKISLIFTYQE